MSEIAESFASSLSELTVNSKPHINMLTMLAEDHLEYAPIITQTVLTHLQKVRPDVKLPVLYLIDSIVKNVGKAYINLFTQSIVQSFTSTFEKVDEKTREQMFKLRQTWSEVFPAKTIYTLDKSVQQIDPAWPVSNPPPTVHLNPKFFKPDMLDSKSLTSTIIQQDTPHIESQSRHRKTKTYSPRNLSVTHSSRSKKVTPTSSTVVDSSKGTPAVAVVKPSPAPDQLREQMIMKQKMLLELQQKKLKLELIQTQAQLQEQQKQLEKQSNNKTSAEISKIQQIVDQEEAKLKLMSKNLKKKIQMNLPKLQQIHKVTSDIKAQKVADVNKMSVGIESLVKPAALLELEKDEISGRPLKTQTMVKYSALPKESKSKITQLQQTAERHKVVTPADSTEEITPVRIAPVSSQLINAALSFGRNVRDPRIRQMSSRLESQFNSTAAQSAPTPPHPSSTTTHPPPPTLPAQENKINLKLRKEKRSNSHQHKERLSRSEEENKHHNRLSSRSSDKSSTKHEKLDKTSPSKRSERKSEKKSKVEDLFSSPRSKSPLQVKSLHSPSKSHSKRDQTNLIDAVEPSSSTSHLERISKIESSPKRAKYHDNWQGVQSSDNISDGGLSKQTQKLSLDVAKAQNTKQSESPKVSVSPEALDNSAEMLDEDIEKIVKHPDIVSKINKIAEVKNIDELHESSKSSDDSIDGKFDEIIKNPTKTSKFEKLNKINDEKVTAISLTSGTPNNEKTKHTKEICSTSTLNNPIDSSQRISYVDENKIELQRTEKQSVPGQAKNIESGEQNLAQSTNDPVVNSTSYVDENIQTFEPSVKEDSKQSEFQFSELTSEQAEVSSTVNSVSETQHSMTKEEFVSTKAENENFIFTNKDETCHNNSSSFEKTEEETPFIQTSHSPQNDFDHSEEVDNLQKLRNPEELILSPCKVQSPIRNVEPMEIIQESNENITSLVEYPPPKKSDKRRESPVHQERKFRKGDKPSIMEQIIADAEKHDASPSPPPPPIISDKFKEIKQSSLSRLRRVGRPREDLADAESPEPADVDLRTQILPSPLPKGSKNEVLGLADKDVDLRNLPVSPAKKRPSMEKLLDIPPAKKSKAEVMDELFGSEDVDLRPVLCPPPPSPPPPPIISSSPPLDSPWARYKQTKPDTYKSKYVPSRRDRAPSVDKFARNSRFNSSEGAGSGGDSWYGRGSRTYQKDVDMRAQPPGNADGSFNTIIIQALEQHNRGDLNDDGYKRVLSEVFTMREKRQLEEAQRRDKAEAAQEAAQAENLEPISDEDISGGSLSGVEDAPSPTESYSGAEDFEDPSLKKTSNEKRKPVIERETKPSEKPTDVDIRVAPTDVDIRNKIDYHPVDEVPSRHSRGESPYSRKAKISEKDRYRCRRDELKAQRKEKRSRRAEEERGSRYRNSRFNEDQWSPHEGRSITPTETMDVDPPRVPPIPHYDDGRNYREPPLTIHPPRFDKDFHPEQHDSPPVRPPVPWEPQRMAGPGPSPWMPGMGPIPRGPPVMGMRAQDRFVGPRWRQPGPGPNFEGEPSSRFNRFGPPPMGRFPVPLAPCEVPPTDPAVVKLIEEDPTKLINIDGLPRDIRFYGLTAVALMSWDDPREVCFQPGQRRVIINDRDSIIVHFNAPPVEVVIDGKPHRIRFGAPTRELYIDNKWYEVFFGGPPVTCDIAGKTHTVQLEGPPPQVRPGAQRKDLVVGKITLIIDAEYLFTVYLDARPQKFEVKGIPYIIRFVEALQTTVINGVAFKSDFGGLPRPIILNGSKHFFRLTALPRGVTPGFLTIVNMEGGRLPSPPTLPAPPQLPATLEQAVDIKPSDPFLQPPMGLLTAPPRVSPEIPKREIEPLPLHPPTIPATVPLTVPPQTVQSKAL
uniref:CID domain-containing protein n=2 Tax=Cuerna arida TaxID=1464854 RepID=A0A1B6EJ89_9HEMI